MSRSPSPRAGSPGPAVDAPPTSARAEPIAAPARRPPRRGVALSIVAVSVGAALGALLRWFLADRLNALFPYLPPGTLVANLVGAYLIGIAMAVFLGLPDLSPAWRLLTVTGFLGGLTTFSTFSAEVVTALLDARWAWALATIFAHVGGSIALTLLGVATVRAVQMVR